MNRIIIESTMTPLQKMQAFDCGVRRENVAACGDDKLRTYRNICIANNLPYALSKIEAEMSKRGILPTQSPSNTQQTQPQPQQPAQEEEKDDIYAMSLVNNKHNLSLFNAEEFKFVRDAKAASEIIDRAKTLRHSLYWLIADLIIAILVEKPALFITDIKDYLLSIDIPMSEVKRLFREVREDKELINGLNSLLTKNESLNKANNIVEELEKTTPYMLRNDGAFLTCGDIHPYIKMQYKQSFEDTYKALLVNYEFLDWFYNNTLLDETKELICKFLTLCEQTPNIIALKDKLGISNALIVDGDTLEAILKRLNDLTNQEFCRARTSNFKYKYGGDNGEIYFRISSKDFDWFNLIWQVVNDHSVFIKFITIMKDYAATGERFAYLSYKGKEFNKMPINEFLTLPGNPIVENLLEAEGKQDTLNPKLWDGMELKPEVKEKIDMIVNEFLDTLKDDDIDIDIADIILVGSNVSYNYTSNSDIDIHIRIDLSKYDEEKQKNIMAKLVSAYAKIWNDKYTISFYDIPVEIFIETKFDVEEDWQLL